MMLPEAIQERISLERTYERIHQRNHPEIQERRDSAEELAYERLQLKSTTTTYRRLQAISRQSDAVHC